MVRQRRQGFDELRQGLRLRLHLPTRLVDDGAETLLAAQLEDVLKLGIHRFALCLGQFQPGGKQCIRLGLLHGREVQIRKQSPAREVAYQQGIGSLPKEGSGGVVPGHASLLSRFALNQLDYMGCCSALQYIHSSPPAPRGDMATAKTTTMTFRIEPELKEALRTASEREHRSIANMVAVLIMDYCERNGIAIPERGRYCPINQRLTVTGRKMTISSVFIYALDAI